MYESELATMFGRFKREMLRRNTIRWISRMGVATKWMGAEEDELRLGSVHHD